MLSSQCGVHSQSIYSPIQLLDLEDLSFDLGLPEGPTTNVASLDPNQLGILTFGRQTIGWIKQA